MKSHDMNIQAKYEIDGKLIKKNTVTGLKGHIVINDKIVLPMRSFVKGFLTELREYFNLNSLSNPPTKRLYSVLPSIPPYDSHGILVGTNSTTVSAADEYNLLSLINNPDLIHNQTTINFPHNDNGIGKFAFTKTFTNDSTVNTIREIAVVASAVNKILLTRDNPPNPITLEGLATLTIKFVFETSLISDLIIDLNLIKYIFNSLFLGSFDNINSQLSNNTGQKPLYGIKTVIEGQEVLSIDKQLGIVQDNNDISSNYGIVIRGDRALYTNPIEDDNFLSYAATRTILTNISVSNLKTAFTIQRDFINTTSQTINIDDAVLLTRGNGINRNTQFELLQYPLRITLQSDQVLRISLELSTSV